MPKEKSPPARGWSPRRENDNAASEKRGRSLLLAIGIDRYQYIGGLHNAVRDVEYLAEVLSRRYQFDKRWATKLINEEATLANISQKFHRLVEEARPEDEVLVYFSGHGAFNQSIDRGFWIPFDGKPDETHTLFSNSTLVDFVASIPARHVVLIVDSCFSGAFFGGVRRLDVPERLSSIPSRWVMTSGRNEVVSDGPPGQNSPFAESLIYHLNANDEAGFRITALFPRIIEQVGANAEQLPRCEPIRNVGHKGGEFVFRLNGAQPGHLELPANYQGAPAAAAGQGIRKNPKTAIRVIAGLIALIALSIAISLTVKRPPEYKWRKDYYDSIQPISRGFIVSKNGLSGYAGKDTMDWIPLLYQEAHPFTGDLARVKRDGKYGWINSSGTEIIPCKYDSARDFKDESALVAFGGRTFSIDTDGKEIAESPAVQPEEDNPASRRESPGDTPPPTPAAPRLRASPETAALENLESGPPKEFTIKIRNTGGKTAEGLRTGSTNGIEVLTGSPFSLGAGESIVLRCRLRTENLPLGNYSGIVMVNGGNLPSAIEVPVTGRIVEAGAPPSAPPAPAVLSAQCYLGPPGCQVSFYDRIQKKTIAFTTDANGNGSYTIAEGLLGGSVEVRYCGNNTLTVWVKEGGCITLPQ